MINSDSIAACLVSHGARPTTQRLKLAELVFERPQHISAEQLLRAARARAIRVSKATVYNTLKLFVECGLVREVVIDRDRVYYDSIVGAHHHFYNVDTGEMTDIPAAAVCFAEVPEAPPGTEQDSVEVIIRVHNRA
jgi:Fur family transcriptional regulator, iron response regulator